MDSVFLVEVPIPSLFGVVTTALRHCYGHRIPSLMLIFCTSSTPLEILGSHGINVVRKTPPLHFPFAFLLLLNYSNGFVLL
ncbi:hypothetical protein DEO72_LG2g1933 [Vigna unguiculata]|uniref:Uncharacterized protein n=1 Tax=Vigna unguiculata TaxID=3917 RepID=A0A4D6L0W5_VIGUN|nr:hypothetical protein DEO72_LG2g1933 [Vigna unguiculata]